VYVIVIRDISGRRFGDRLQKEGAVRMRSEDAAWLTR
jgi:hypothetical protein